MYEDKSHETSMVDISSKPAVYREATASGRIRLKKETINLIRRNSVEKGDAIVIAKIAGTLAAKNTSILIPLCHQIPITSIDVDVNLGSAFVEVSSTVKAIAKTGVEMEALVAATVALLTIWDMVKQYEKDAAGQYATAKIEDVHVVQKIKGE
jgi:cyclic pyranopterin phosphate synthase